VKNIIFLGLLSLVTMNFLSADEYLSNTYLEEIVSQSEIIDESMDNTLPITKTVEEEERAKLYLPGGAVMTLTGRGLKHRTASSSAFRPPSSFSLPSTTLSVGDVTCPTLGRTSCRRLCHHSPCCWT